MLIDSKHNAPSTDMTCGQRAGMHKRTKSLILSIKHHGR
jgi:hypothetical protein